MKNKNIHLEMQKNSKRAEAMLKQIANAKRLIILCNIVSDAKTVYQLEELTNLSQSAVSQHLAKLKSQKLVISEKKGKEVYYKLASMEVQAILSTLYLIYCNK
jgi:ArsR family transcriptional regulator